MCKLLLPFLLLLAIHASAASLANYQDSFARSGMLADAPPDMLDSSMATWNADSLWTTSGGSVSVNATGNPRVAMLPFAPTTNTVYVLTYNLTAISSSDTTRWAGVGFFNSDIVNEIGGSDPSAVYNDAIAFYLQEANGTGQTFYGNPGLNNGSGNVAGTGGTGTNTITLAVTNNGVGTLTFARNGTVFRGPVSLTAAQVTNIQYAGMICMDGVTASASWFSLTSSPPARCQFPWVGATLVTQERLEHIPGRTFLDFNGQPTDAVIFFAANNFNAVRVNVNYGQAMGTTNLDNSNLNSRESNFTLDFGGVDFQVDMARRVKATGGKILLMMSLGQNGPTNNLHEYIPVAWLNYTYAQTCTAIDSAVRQMLDQFLNAGIQPDIILLENEGDSGMLFQTTNSLGQYVLRDDTTTDPMSATATGTYKIWPKCAGYYKQMILSMKDELQVKGFDPAATRFGLDSSWSTDYTARFVFGEVFNNAHADAESVYYDTNGVSHGTLTNVPANLRAVNLRDICNVFGMSCYPNEPTNSTLAEFNRALQPVRDTYDNFASIIPGYGVFTNGAFVGQSKVQIIISEYTTSLDWQGNSAYTLSVQQAYTTAFLGLLANYNFALGALWFEPTYANNNYYGGSSGALYDRGAYNNSLHIYPTFTPTATITNWGQFALPNEISPVAMSVANAGFESPALASGNYSYSPASAGWNFSAHVGNSGAGTSANNSAFTSSNPGAPWGLRVGFIQSTGSISQVITSSVPGEWTVVLSAAQRASQPSGGRQTINITIDGNAIGSFTPTTEGSYGVYSATSSYLAAGPHTLALLGTSSADNTAFMDNVAVSVIDFPDAAPINLSVTLASGQIILTWPRGILLQATNLTGPWTTNAAASPVTIFPTAPQMFFRVKWN